MWGLIESLATCLTDRVTFICMYSLIYALLTWNWIVCNMWNWIVCNMWNWIVCNMFDIKCRLHRMCNSSCLRTLDVLLKLVLHFWHTNGRSPVCINSCLCKRDFLQKSHITCFTNKSMCTRAFDHHYIYIVEWMTAGWIICHISDRYTFIQRGILTCNVVKLMLC